MEGKVDGAVVLQCTKMQGRGLSLLSSLRPCFYDRWVFVSACRDPVAVRCEPEVPCLSPGLPKLKVENMNDPECFRYSPILDGIKVSQG